MEQKYKYVVGGFLVLIIIVTSTLLFMNWDSWFRQEINVTYPDNCVETYINSKQVSPNCTQGRLMTKSTLNISNIPTNFTVPIQ